MWSNGRGRPQLVDWLAVGLGADGDHRIDDLFDVLDTAGVGPRIANPGIEIHPVLLQHALPGVVTAARAELDQRRAVHDERVDELLAGPRNRLEAWVGRSNQLALELEIERRRTDKLRQIDEVEASTARLIESLRTTGTPLVRVLAVLVPKGTDR